MVDEFSFGTEEASAVGLYCSKKFYEIVGVNAQLERQMMLGAHLDEVGLNVFV